MSVTDESDQEDLLVELAQSLLYYNDRHNKASDAKAVTLTEVSSLSSNGTNGNVSKTVNTKGSYSANNIYRKALNAYKKASQLSLNKNLIKYTQELSELAVKLQKKNELVQIFDGLLQHGGDETGTYLAHIDYADGLTKFKDNSAESQFLSAISLRNPVDGVEANYRYANYLLKKDKPREALLVLEKFTFEERRMYVHIAMLRQKIMHLLKMDTQEVDAEIKRFRQNLSKSPAISKIPKTTGIVKHGTANVLGLHPAYAFTFSHHYEVDDSRGKYSDGWVMTPLSYLFTTTLINASEVVYNEARGDKHMEKLAVAWAIRNRATIDMNGCDFYPGAESDPMVSACRATTTEGPQSDFIDPFKRDNCVVHGGTTSVGASHSQMNDAHVNIADLESSGIIWVMLNVIWGWSPDPSGPYSFLTATYPNKDISSGNPNGAQEWRRNNSCPEKHACKTMLGSFDGNFLHAGELCLTNAEPSDNKIFWGRKTNNLILFLSVN